MSLNSLILRPKSCLKLLMSIVLNCTPAQRGQRRPGNLLRRRLLGALHAGGHHVGLEINALLVMVALRVGLTMRQFISPSRGLKSENSRLP